MKTCVVGAGTMGHGIAQVFARAGHDVILIDSDHGVLKKAAAKIRLNLDQFVMTGIISPQESTETMERIRFASNLDAAKDIQFATEAIPENMALKQGIFRKLEATA